MDGQGKSFSHSGMQRSQRGNAMVYVLIIVALFGALSFVLSRQTNTSESAVIPEGKVEIYASDMQQASAQLKQAIDQMTFTGITIDQLDFITPDDANFDVGSNVAKVFHPAGGGIVMPRIPDEALSEISTDPPARWYIGRFNNVEWTPSAAEDVILTAHQINQQICERINEKLTGSNTVPELVGTTVNKVLIAGIESTVGDGNNIDFTSVQCPGCYGKPALCVKDSGVNAWSFYSLMAIQ